MTYIFAYVLCGLATAFLVGMATEADGWDEPDILVPFAAFVFWPVLFVAFLMVLTICILGSIGMGAQALGMWVKRKAGA